MSSPSTLTMRSTNLSGSLRTPWSTTFRRISSQQSLTRSDSALSTPADPRKAVTSSKGRDLRVVVAAGELVCAFVRHNDKDFKSNLHQGGYIESFDPPAELVEQSIALADAFGLKMGSIDYLFGEREGEFLLCEVNSVPGISYVFKAQSEGDDELVRRFFSMPKKILHREGIL